MITRFKNATYWVKCVNANSDREFLKAYDLLIKINLDNASQHKFIRNSLMRGFLESQIGKLEDSVRHLEFVIYNIDNVPHFSQQEKIYLKGYASFCLSKFHSKVNSSLPPSELTRLISMSKNVNLSAVRDKYLGIFPLRYHPEWEAIGKY